MSQETPLEMAERHVRRGEYLVARQKNIVEKTRGDDGMAALSADLLRTFEETLAMQREHLRVLQFAYYPAGNGQARLDGK